MEDFLLRFDTKTINKMESFLPNKRHEKNKNERVIRTEFKYLR